MKNTPAPGDLPVEIERKFLIDALPPGLDAFPHRDLVQGYVALGDDGTEVRLRRLGDRLYQTVKQGSGLQRIEAEIPLTAPQFDALWPLTAGRRVEKTRYAVAYKGHTIELDVYRGALASLVTAEVEFDTVAAGAAFRPPPWFGVEITDDARYKNKNLAVYGAP